VKITAAIIISYLLAGAYYVWGDLRQPVYIQPAYIRSRRLSAVALALLAWLPTAIWVLTLVGYHSTQGRQAIRSLVVFAAAIAISLFLTRDDYEQEGKLHAWPAIGTVAERTELLGRSVKSCTCRA
jgi:hypothetical protein